MPSPLIQPGSDSLSREFFRLAEIVARAEARQAAIRERLRAQDPGRYDSWTVYHVGETTVRSHKRRAYTAVRFVRRRR